MRSFIALVAALLISLMITTTTMTSAQSNGPTYDVCNSKTNTYSIPPQSIATIGSWNTTGQYITLNCLFAMTANHILTDISLVCSPQQKLGPFVTVAYFKDSHYLPNYNTNYACPFQYATWSLAAFNPYTDMLNIVSVGNAAISNSSSVSASDAPATFIPNEATLAHNSKNKAVPALQHLAHSSRQHNAIKVARDNNKAVKQTNLGAIQICGNDAQNVPTNTQYGFAYHYWTNQGTTLDITCFGAFSSPVATVPLAVDVMVACSDNLNFDNDRIVLGTFNTAFAPVYNARYTCPFNGFFAIIWFNKAQQTVDMYINADGQVS